MPRYPRLFLPNMPLHIVQRGHNRRTVFSKAADFQRYIDNLIEIKLRLEVRVFGYCLMPNHVHLIVAPGPRTETVSEMIKVIAARQTRNFNKSRKRTGTLWEGRFKASLIETDSYLLACYRYVDLNPVRAMIVARPELYRWSSYRRHAGGQCDGWLDNADVYLSLGRNTSQRANAYAKIVAAGSSDEELQLIRTAAQRNQITGTERFAQMLEASTGRRISFRCQGRPNKRNKSDTFLEGRPKAGK